MDSTTNIENPMLRFLKVFDSCLNIDHIERDRCYTIVSTENLVIEVNEALKIATCLQLTPEVLKFLLDYHFNWNLGKLQLELSKNRKEVFRYARISGLCPSKLQKLVSFITKLTKRVLQLNKMCCCCSDEESYRVSSCEHSFCERCWSIAINQKIDSKFQSVLKCPADVCLVRYATVMNLIHPSKIAKFLRLYVSNYVNSDNYMDWCTRPSCKFLVMAETLYVGAVQCKCYNSFCFMCREEPHFPINCEMLKSWKSLLQARDFLDNENQCTELHLMSKHNTNCSHCTEAFKAKKVAKQEMGKSCYHKLKFYYLHYIWEVKNEKYRDTILRCKCSGSEQSLMTVFEHYFELRNFLKNAIIFSYFLQEGDDNTKAFINERNKFKKLLGTICKLVINQDDPLQYTCSMVRHNMIMCYRTSEVMERLISDGYNKDSWNFIQVPDYE